MRYLMSWLFIFPVAGTKRRVDLMGERVGIVNCHKPKCRISWTNIMILIYFHLTCVVEMKVSGVHCVTSLHRNLIWGRWKLVHRKFKNLEAWRTIDFISPPHLSGFPGPSFPLLRNMSKLFRKGNDGLGYTEYRMSRTNLFAKRNNFYWRSWGKNAYDLHKVQTSSAHVQAHDLHFDDGNHCRPPFMVHGDHRLKVHRCASIPNFKLKFGASYIIFSSITPTVVIAQNA